MKKLSLLIILISLITQANAFAMRNFIGRIGTKLPRLGKIVTKLSSYSTTTNVKHHITVSPSWAILPMLASAYYTWQNINDLALLQAIRQGSVKYIDKALKRADINKEYTIISMSPLLVGITSGNLKISSQLLQNPELSKNSISFALNYCEKVSAAVDKLLVNRGQENNPQEQEAINDAQSIIGSYFLIKKGFIKSIVEKGKKRITFDNKNNNTLSKEELENLKNELRDAIPLLAKAEKDK